MEKVKNPVDTHGYPLYSTNVKKQYLIGLFVLSLLLVSCLGWIMEEPSLVLREISVKPRSLTEIDLLLGLEIHNPNRFDLTLKSFEYKAYLNHQEIGNGHLEKELVIPSSSTTRLQVPVAARFADWGTSLRAVMVSENLPYKIEGKTDIKAVWGSLSFPFSKEGHIHLKN